MYTYINKYCTLVIIVMVVLSKLYVFGIIVYIYIYIYNTNDDYIITVFSESLRARVRMQRPRRKHAILFETVELSSARWCYTVAMETTRHGSRAHVDLPQSNGSTRRT